jgi:hypothetical protein
MKRVVLPQPPNANDVRYSNNQLAFNRDVSDWMSRVKGLLEDSDRVNNRPMGQQFVVGSFTTNTTISGTSTGTDVANFLSSLITAMQAKGVVSQTVSRSGG